VLPIMRAQGSGPSVDIISGIAFYPMPYQTMYSATKAALNGLTLALRYELWDVISM
jgi:short-subunit dehydrogenase